MIVETLREIASDIEKELLVFNGLFADIQQCRAASDTKEMDAGPGVGTRLYVLIPRDLWLEVCKKIDRISALEAGAE